VQVLRFSFSYIDFIAPTQSWLSVFYLSPQLDALEPCPFFFFPRAATRYSPVVGLWGHLFSFFLILPAFLSWLPRCFPVLFCRSPIAYLSYRFFPPVVPPFRHCGSNFDPWDPFFPEADPLSLPPTRRRTPFFLPVLFVLFFLVILPL